MKSHIIHFIHQLNRRTILCVIYALVSVLLAIILLCSNIIPFLFSMVIIVVLIFLNLIIGRALLRKRTNNSIRTNRYVIIVAIVLTAMNFAATLSLLWSISLLNKVTSDPSIVKKDVTVTKPFNLYISGIDTYGDIDTVSRSDVNIVATINPEKRRILLTTIPRDSYVRIAGGGMNEYDKLTHSGIYGIDSSVSTIEQLLDIKVASYARINFTSLVKIVDEIGGIRIYNPVAFQTDAKQEFNQGWIKLNGKDALAYSRERHNLAGGDNDRGVNQQRVITGIFDKITTPSILNNYVQILDTFGDATQTNMSQSSIINLIHQLLIDSGYWKVESQSISGSGETGELPSYAMPNSQLYMFVLSQQSLQDAKARIRSTYETKS